MFKLITYCVLMVLLNFSALKAEGQIKRTPTSTEVKAQTKSSNPNYEELGRKALVEKKYDLAIEYLKKTSESPTPRSLSLLALAYRLQKSYLDEIRTLEVILQLKDKAPTVHQLLGEAYFKIEKYDKASEHFREYVKLDKTSKEGYRGLLKVFEATDNKYETRTILTEMLKVFGEDHEVLSKLCKLYTEDSLFEQGLDHCRKAIVLKRSFPDNHVYMALNLKALQKRDEAYDVLLGTAKTFTKSEFAQWHAGQMSEDLGNLETAVSYYKKCIQADSKSDRCYHRLAMTSFALKDYGQALKSFEKACSFDKKYYTDLRNATAELRIKRVIAWEQKYQNASDKCGLSTSGK